MADHMETGPVENQFVIDQAKSSISDLWKKEDYWAIWLGFFILIAGFLIFSNNMPSDYREVINSANSKLETLSSSTPFRTIEWHQAVDSKSKLKASASETGKSIKSFISKPHGWSSNPLDAFFMSSEKAEQKKASAMKKYEAAKAEEEKVFAIAASAQKLAMDAGFKDEKLNKDAEEAIDSWRKAKTSASSAKSKSNPKAYNQIVYLIGMMILLGVFFSIGMKVMGTTFIKFFTGFCFVFLLAVIAYAASSNATMKHYGIGYAAWAILFGLIISNTIGTPKWIMPAVQTEYYIKTGLVLLGAEILFGKILQIGIPGIFVAWVVTPIVLVSTYIFGQKVLKIPSKTLNITISSDMSVCGVSAAIATASACRAKKEELTLAVGLSLIFTSIMMIVMPAIIKAVDMPHVLGGAWMGGTIDATGAVAAAGAFLSDKALYVAATVKMIQNVMIGVIAFAVAIYWCAKVECLPGQRVGAIEIWHRFPKFVLGFLFASVVFSIVYETTGKDIGYTLIDNGVIGGLSSTLRGWFFCLAFVSIGLATNFRELKDHFKGGKPLILYVCGQSFNLILTLLMAYIMFYKVFPEITAKI